MATAGFACLLEFFPGRQLIGWGWDRSRAKEVGLLTSSNLACSFSFDLTCFSSFPCIGICSISVSLFLFSRSFARMPVHLCRLAPSTGSEERSLSLIIVLWGRLTNRSRIRLCPCHPAPPSPAIGVFYWTLTPTRSLNESEVTSKFLMVLVS